MAAVRDFDVVIVETRSGVTHAAYVATARPPSASLLFPRLRHDFAKKLSYFGINPQNTDAQSHFHNYSACGGLKDAKLGVAGLYHFTDHWFVDADFGIERLLGSAPGSPIVQTDWNWTLAGTSTTRFDFQPRATADMRGSD